MRLKEKNTYRIFFFEDSEKKYFNHKEDINANLTWNDPYTLRK